MSHDRTCPCGREPYDYDGCTRAGCDRREACNRTRYAQLTLADCPHVRYVADQIRALTGWEKRALVLELERGRGH